MGTVSRWDMLGALITVLDLMLIFFVIGYVFGPVQW